MEEDVRIRTFGDALVEAFALSEQFRQAHTAVVVDDRGKPFDMTVFAAPHHTPDDALAWVADVEPPGEAIVRLILISIGRDGVEELREADIRRFVDARCRLAARGLHLVDHLLCDGDKVRSVAMSSGVAAWDEDGSPVDMQR
jgi:hypothetical protein